MSAWVNLVVSSGRQLGPLYLDDRTFAALTASSASCHNRKSVVALRGECSRRPYLHCHQMTSLRHHTLWLAIGIWTRLLSSYPEYPRGDSPQATRLEHLFQGSPWPAESSKSAPGSRGEGSKPWPEYRTECHWRLLLPASCSPLAVRNSTSRRAGRQLRRRLIRRVPTSELWFCQKTGTTINSARTVRVRP